jgi:hypothetical protein
MRLVYCAPRTLPCLAHAAAGRTSPAGERGSAAGSLARWLAALCSPPTPTALLAIPRGRQKKALQRTEGEAVATVEAMVATEANMLAAAASTMIVVVAVAGGAT